MTNQLELSDYIVAFDVETTGIDKTKSRIIQLSAIRYTKNWKKVSEMNHYILPTGIWEIEPEAQEVHGLSKEFIQDQGLPLKDVYNEWLEIIDGCDIVTYNGNSFDIPIMYADFGREGLDPHIIEHRLIDVLQIEREVNSNTLSAAYERYTGKEAIDAHDSSADVKMTMRVLYEQMKRYDISSVLKEEDMHMEFPEQILTINENKQIIFTGGKHKNELVFDVIKKDPSYIKWLFGNVLSPASKAKVMEEYERLKN